MLGTIPLNQERIVAMERKATLKKEIVMERKATVERKATLGRAHANRMELERLGNP